MSEMTLWDLAQKMRSDVAHISNPNIVATAKRCAEQVEQWARDKAKEWDASFCYECGGMKDGIIDLGVPDSEIRSEK